MPDTKYAEDTNRFLVKGVDLNHPVDAIPPDRLAIAQNVRVVESGSLTNRPGLTDIALVVASQTPTHSCRRLNDPNGSTWARIVGAGTILAYGQTSFTQADTGYSGNPLALVPWWTEYAPQPWMYVADSSKMRKIQVDGTLHPIGLAAPAGPPTAALTTPFVTDANIRINKNVTSGGTEDAAANWAQGGDAGAPSNIVRVDTTVDRIVYDSGSTGWAVVAPASFASLSEGARLVFDDGGADEEVTYVAEVHPGAAATTIATILYDSGTSGLASLALTTANYEAEVNGLIYNSTLTEAARILSVTTGPQGVTAIRVSTTGTWAATNAVQLLASFRCYLANTHAAAEDIDSSTTPATNGAVRTAITFSTGTATLTDTAAMDLSLAAAGVPLQVDDWFHISVRVDLPARVTELKFQLDVDSATNDFTRNFYTKSFRASDLTPSITNVQPTLATDATVLQRDIIDQGSTGGLPTVQLPSGYSYDANSGSVIEDSSGNTVPPEFYYMFGIDPSQIGAASTQQSYVAPTQLSPGNSQWVELFWRFADMTRVGTDLSRTFVNVAALRVTAIVTANVTLDFNSWWVGGGYGTDCAAAPSDYLYRYRARHPSTNVASNFSPALRGGVQARRQRITVTPTQYPLPSGMSGAATDFVLDIERFGGEIADWRYAGTTANAASPSFTDEINDITVGGNPAEGNINYQPWPVKDVPRTGTTGSVAGTTITDSGVTFNTSWAPGTRILINQLPYTIYRVLSTSRLELVENAGSQGAVTWRIPEPVLLAQPLPCLWEFDHVLFGCGDNINPGRLYFTRNPGETTRINNYLDIGAPSEPLMNGMNWNARSYLWTPERQGEITFTGNPSSPYRWDELPGGRGLFSRWALTRYNSKSPFMAFLSKDGIYKSTGGVSDSLTDRDLYPLFPHEGQLGSTVRGIPAPNVVSAQASNLRMEFTDDLLYFDFNDTSSNRRSLIYAPELDGWWYDAYTPGVVFHYGEEGQGVHAILCGGADATTSRLYQLTGNSDNGTAISCQARTRSADQGEPRLNKLYGDQLADLDPAGVTVTMTPRTNNDVTSYTAVTSAAAARTQTAIPFGTSWATARNCSLDFAWSVSTSSHPTLYIWAPRWTFESAPISAIAWEISPSTLGMQGYKHLGRYRLTYVSSTALELIVTVDGTAQTAISLASSAGVYATVIGIFPVYKGTLYKFRIGEVDQNAEWRLDGRDSYIETKEWGSEGPYRQLRVFSDYSVVEG